MKVDIDKLPKSRIKLLIEVSKEELGKYVKLAGEKLQKEVAVKGFRTGKAPLNLIEKEVGNARYQQEILEIAVSQSYFAAISENKLVPLGPPQIKLIKFVPSDILTYEAEVEILPEVKIADYKRIEVKKPKFEVKKEDTETVLSDLRKRSAKVKEVDRPAGKGDKVEVDFEGFLGGAPLEGGKSQNQPLVIGEKMFIPGFEENLVGLKKDDQKKFEITFPKDFAQKNLAGKKAKFEVKMKQVCQVDLPTLDDNFAKALGKKNLAELKKELNISIKEKKEAEAKRKMEEEILSKILEKTEVEVPESLIQSEVEREIENLKNNLERSGLTLERYLEHLKKSLDEVKLELRGESERRVKIGLVLRKIAELEKIEAKEKEIKEEISRILETYTGDREEFKKKAESNEVKKDIEGVIVARKTMDKLIEYAQE